MRIFFTSLMAFFISGFAGGIVAQLIAEKTYATEEFIIVFMLSALVTIGVTVLFFIAQFLSDARTSVSRLGKWLLGIWIILSIGLIVFSVVIDGIHVPERKEIWFLVACIVPGFLTILSHWWFVRWRVGNTPAHFGRGPETPA